MIYLLNVGLHLLKGIQKTTSRLRHHWLKCHKRNLLMCRRVSQHNAIFLLPAPKGAGERGERDKGTAAQNYDPGKVLRGTHTTIIE